MKDLIDIFVMSGVINRYQQKYTIHTGDRIKVLSFKTDKILICSSEVQLLAFFSNSKVLLGKHWKIHKCV